MLWSFRYRLLRWLLHLLVHLGVDERGLETAVLRHQLRVLRRGGARPHFTTADRAFLAAVARLLSRDRWRSFLVRPETLVRWHRELLRTRGRGRSRRPGRPPLDSSVKELILRLGRENPRWGYLRIKGELLKLGICVSHTTIATVLRQGGPGPAPRRIGPTWTQFLWLQAQGLLSPGPRTEGEDDVPEDVASGPQDAPTLISEDPEPAGHDEPIDDPRCPRRRPIARADARLHTSATVVAPHPGARARDGTAFAA